MKNELGIKICCENCIVKDSTILRQTFDCEYCRKNEYAFYHTKDEIYRNRIKELQEQQFTEDELHIIINMTSILLGQDHYLYDSLLTPLSKKLKRMINER